MNLIGKFRSNYFAVKDRKAYEAWCGQRGLRLLVHKGLPLVGFVNQNNEAGIPTIGVTGSGEEEEIDFLAELSTFLADGHVAVITEIASEGNRYLVGAAYAVNTRGERKSIHLAQIMPLARTLGEHVTPCEY
jgi:hypothetical protein